MEGKARILIYGFSAEEAERIGTALAALGAPPPTRLRSTQAHVVLSQIIHQDKEGAESFSCPERLVLFYNTSDTGIRTLIPHIRKLGVPRPIFAVVTGTSIHWTLAELMEHLIEEKRGFAQRARAARCGKAQPSPQEPEAPAEPEDQDSPSHDPEEPESPPRDQEVPL